MSLWQSAVLGIVEGLTEYLPVSSTGHLLLAQRAMGLTSEMSSSVEAPMRSEAMDDAKAAADAYAICIQAGAIVAVLGLYFRRVRQMGRGLLGRDEAGRRMLINILAGFLPAAVIGLLFNDIIKEYLFGPKPVVAAWFLGGVAILAVTWHRRGDDREAGQGKKLEDLTWQLALIIGFAQCIAMWPGVSRSLITIVGGVLVGLRLAAAVEFSFLLGVITLGAATCYDAAKHGDLMLEYYSWPTLLVGLLFAFLSAVVAVKWMVSYLQNHSMAIFGYYRVAIAVIVGMLLVFEVI
jgi:undecaprenyl-diphosphatase